jgi:hypothetical protein
MTYCQISCCQVHGSSINSFLYWKSFQEILKDLLFCWWNKGNTSEQFWKWDWKVIIIIKKCCLNIFIFNSTFTIKLIFVIHPNGWKRKKFIKNFRRWINNSSFKIGSGWSFLCLRYYLWSLRLAFGLFSILNETKWFSNSWIHSSCRNL